MERVQGGDVSERVVADLASISTTSAPVIARSGRLRVGQLALFFGLSNGEELSPPRCVLVVEPGCALAR